MSESRSHWVPLVLSLSSVLCSCETLAGVANRYTDNTLTLTHTLEIELEEAQALTNECEAAWAGIEASLDAAEYQVESLAVFRFGNKFHFSAVREAVFFSSGATIIDGSGFVEASKVAKAEFDRSISEYDAEAQALCEQAYLSGSVIRYQLEYELPASVKTFVETVPVSVAKLIEIRNLGRHTRKMGENNSLMSEEEKGQLRQEYAGIKAELEKLEALHVTVQKDAPKRHERIEALLLDFHRQMDSDADES